MSGERFYVVEVEGHDVSSAGGRPTRPGTVTCSVLDRAYCHREVARFKEQASDFRTKVARIESARGQAASEAERLNAEYGR